MENKTKIKSENYSWKKITISQYKRIAQLPKDDEWSLGVLAILEGKTLLEIMNSPIDWVLAATKNLKTFLEQSPKIGVPKHKYQLGDTTYILTQNPASVTTAQYLDYINAPKELPQNLGLLLAILMVPEGKEYNDGYSLEKSISDIENYLDVESAYGIASFATGCLRILLKKRLKAARKALQAAKKDGVPTQEAETQVKQMLRELSLFTA